MRKVLITKEQEQALAVFKVKDYPFELFVKGGLQGTPIDVLNELNTAQMSLALNGWYDLEEEQKFKVGFWMHCEDTLETFKVAEVLRDGSLVADKPTWIKRVYSPKYCREAEPVEVREEMKNRTIDAKLDDILVELNSQERTRLKMKLRGGE